MNIDNQIDPEVLEAPLLPRGPTAEQQLIEHRTEGHEPSLETAGQCPLCYLITLPGHEDPRE